MSGYGYSTSDQGNYSYPTAYPTAVPQYTQTQINQYYAQYQCYPPQPYHVISDYYAQPVAVAHTSHQQTMTAPAYDSTHWQGQAGTLDVPVSQGPTRSNSRTRTWTCDIPSCTSSANFTRLADLERHKSTVHGVGVPEYPCTVPRCNRVGSKGFTRRDHLVEHLRNFHHIEIPKRRPGERSAFPFGFPEGFQSQGASSSSEGGARATRSDERGRVLKPSRRGGSASGRSRAGSRPAGIEQMSDASQEAQTVTEQQEEEERGRQPERRHVSDAGTSHLDPLGMHLADTLLAFEDLPGPSTGQQQSEDCDPWDLA